MHGFLELTQPGYCTLKRVFFFFEIMVMFQDLLLVLCSEITVGVIQGTIGNGRASPTILPSPALTEVLYSLQPLGWKPVLTSWTHQVSAPLERTPRTQDKGEADPGVGKVRECCGQGSQLSTTALSTKMLS